MNYDPLFTMTMMGFGIDAESLRDYLRDREVEDAKEDTVAKKILDLMDKNNLTWFDGYNMTMEQIINVLEKMEKLDE